MDGVVPARRGTDRCIAVGFFGLALSVDLLGLSILLVPEPDRPSHLLLAAAAFVISVLPWWSALCITRFIRGHHRRTRSGLPPAREN